MIARDEIEAKARELRIHPANVERDYVFGWLLAGIYRESPLASQLVLKGGNCFRKGYFPATRFSNDLDFSSEGRVDPDNLIHQLNEVCRGVETTSGIQFLTDRTRAQEKKGADNERQICQARVYFKDFYGNPDSITISVRIDIAGFDRLYLPVQDRVLIHPYSDVADCAGLIRCVKIEELLAIKLKCLIQRRHLADLFDLVYGVFINNELAVDREEILHNFLQRTIFRSSPGSAKSLLLAAPFESFRQFWHEYLVCPIQSLFDFDTAIQGFREVIESIFGAVVPGRHGEVTFFPAHLRNVIMQAASNQRLLELDYQGVRRHVEPYSLVFKRRQDGLAREYLYVYDRTGGRSGPGIKALLHTGISSLQVTEEPFEPRFPIELSKAGEIAGRGYFGSPFGGTRRRTARGLVQRSRWIYTVQCRYCGRQFKRLKSSTRLREHKDGFGNKCLGRSGHVVDRSMG